MEATSSEYSTSDASEFKASGRRASDEATNRAKKARNDLRNLPVMIVGVLLLALMSGLVGFFLSGRSDSDTEEEYYTPEELEYQEPLETGRKDESAKAIPDEPATTESAANEPAAGSETVTQSQATAATTRLVRTSTHKTSRATKASTERTRRKRRRRSTRVTSTSTKVTSTTSSTTVSSTTVSPTTESPTTESPTTLPPKTVSLTTPPPKTVSSTTPPPKTVSLTTPPPKTVSLTTPPPKTVSLTTPPPKTVPSTAVPPTTISSTTLPSTTVSATPKTSEASTSTSPSAPSTTVHSRVRRTAWSPLETATASMKTMGVTATAGSQGLARTVLCTLGSGLDTFQKVPPDGLCDLLFYTHAALPNDRPSLPESFSMFLEAAQSARLTLYGVSVDINKAAGAAKALKTADGQQMFRTLWHKNVRQHGILNAAGENSDFDYFLEKEFSLLRSFKALQQKFSTGILPAQPPSVVALGVKMTKYTSKKEREIFPEKLKKMARVLPIDVLVVITHQSTWDMSEDYATSGASMWYNVNDVNEPSLSATIPMLKSAALPENLTVMMSFTMAVSVFTMPKGWNRTQYVAFTRWKPLDFSQVDYSRTCAANLGDGKLQQKQLFWVRGSVQDHYQIIYDTKETMLRKVNYTLLSYTRRRFGWALFDIQHDDYDNTCRDDGGRGFYRTRTVRKFLRSRSNV